MAIFIPKSFSRNLGNLYTNFPGYLQIDQSFTSDLFLAWIGRIIFPWKRRAGSSSKLGALFSKLLPKKTTPAVPVET